MFQVGKKVWDAWPYVLLVSLVWYKNEALDEKLYSKNLQVTNLTILSWAELWVQPTVRPRLSSHIGTGTYRDKRFVRMWELCFQYHKFSTAYTCYNVCTQY